MTLFHDIAARLGPEGLESLAKFRAAAREDRELPAALNELPMGFLAGVGFTDDFTPLFVLSPFGMRVALASEELAVETMSPEEKIADMRRRLAEAGFGSSFDGAVLSVAKESA